MRNTAAARRHWDMRQVLENYLQDISSETWTIQPLVELWTITNNIRIFYEFYWVIVFTNNGRNNQNKIYILTASGFRRNWTKFKFPLIIVAR